MESGRVGHQQVLCYQHSVSDHFCGTCRKKKREYRSNLVNLHCGVSAPCKVGSSALRNYEVASTTYCEHGNVTACANNKLATREKAHFVVTIWKETFWV